MTDYIFVGKGTGVPGLPHEIPGSLAKTWKEEYEAATKEKDVNPVALAAMPWAQLQGGLENGNYKKGKIKPPPPPPEEDEEPEETKQEDES